MGDSRVESLDDEELLVYYDSTKKLLENRLKDSSTANGKIEILHQKISNIEEELKARSLWENE